MRTLARFLLVALVAHAAAFAAPAVAQAQDSSAVAVNKKDGKSVFKLAFSVKKASGDVDATNVAYAYSECTDCKTVAAAIQVVLVSDAGSVAPENVALDINYQCTECESLAAAYQFIFASGAEVEFTKEGKERLHELKKMFHDLKQRDDLTIDQLAAEIAAIAAEVAEVVDTEVVLKKQKEKEAATEDSTTTTAGNATSAPTSTNSPSTTAAPASESVSTTAPTTSPPTTAATSDTSPSTTTGP